MTNEQPASLSIDEPSGADYGDSPLVDFWCEGAGYERRTGVGKTSGRPYSVVHLYGIDLDILETTEPYPFNTSELQIFYSDPTKTPRRREGQGINDWEAFSESLRQFFPNNRAEALDTLFGSQVIGNGETHTAPTKPGVRFRMTRVPTLMRVGPDANAAATALANGDEATSKMLSTWHDELQPAWKVTEVVGMGSNNGASVTNTLDYVLNLADNQTEEAFYALAMDDPEVMKNPSLVQQLSQRRFIQQMYDMNKLKIENGVLRKV